MRSLSWMPKASSSSSSSSCSRHGQQLHQQYPSCLPQSKRTYSLFSTGRRQQQSKKASSSSSEQEKTFEFKEFDIDSILSEAEDALKVAEQSLGGQSDHDNIDSDDNEKKKKSPTVSGGMDAETLQTTVAGTMGGLVLGSILGSIATLQMPGIVSKLEESSNVPVPSILVLPLLGGLILGIVGLIGGLQDTNTLVGTVTKNLLAAPILALVSAILSNIQQQVQKTTDDIKNLPQNLATSAQRTVQSSVTSAVDGVTSLPRKAREAVVQSSVQAADTVKSSVQAAVQEVTSLPGKARDSVLQTGTEAVETVKQSLRRPASTTDTSMVDDSEKRDFLLALVVIPAVIALCFLALGIGFAGQVPSLPSSFSSL